MRLWIDTETRSSVPIAQGIARYATDVQVIVVQYAIDDGPVCVLDEFSCVDELSEAAKRADEIWAHNAEFDRTVLTLQSWWPAVRPDVWRCTAALARMHGLPGSLDALSTIFKLGDSGKDAAGKALIKLFCIPNKAGAYSDKRSHPTDWAKFLEYGRQDVVAMRTLHSKIPHWNATPRMWAVFRADYDINKRGVAIDAELCRGAIQATTAAKRAMADVMAEATLGGVTAATQRDKLLRFLRDCGLELPDLTADTVERRLNDDSVPGYLKELLRIRQQGSKSSTAKYQRVERQNLNGRLHNMLLLCGASRTGRWSGRTIQPQNLPRPKHKKDEIENAIAMFKAGGADLYAPDDIMGLASSALRGVLVPSAGNKLLTADYANIEGRFVAWVVGEDWKIKAFRDYDAGTGPDLYKVSYGRAFGVDPAAIADEGDDRRQVGKVMELALQYYGGVGAFCAMAETYSLDLKKLAVDAKGAVPPGIMSAALAEWEGAKKNARGYGLDIDTWAVLQSLVTMWRRAHPATVRFWRHLDEAVRTVINDSSVARFVGRVSVSRVGNWLRIKLPSGRFLCYPGIRIEPDGQISFLGVNPYSRRWGRIHTYSGKLTENIAQGGCADLLYDAVLDAEDAHYHTVLTVHDELITDVPDTDEFTPDELCRIMGSASLWARSLPLAAKGATKYRYGK